MSKKAQTSKRKWIRKWSVPRSTGEGFWTVSEASNGEWGCSCPAWKFKREQCHHIEQVRAGIGVPIGSAPRTIILANVQQVTLKGKDKALVPLMPIGDAHFQATIAYDLLLAGIPWSEIKEKWGGRNAMKTIRAYIEHHGRRTYGAWVDGKGYTGFITVSAKEPLPEV